MCIRHGFWVVMLVTMCQVCCTFGDRISQCRLITLCIRCLLILSMMCHACCMVEMGVSQCRLITFRIHGRYGIRYSGM